MWWAYIFLIGLVVVAGAGLYLGTETLRDRKRFRDLESQLWATQRLSAVGRALTKGLELDLGMPIHMVPANDWTLRAEDDGSLIFVAEKTFDYDVGGKQRFDGQTPVYGPGFERRFRLVSTT